MVRPQIPPPLFADRSFIPPDTYDAFVSLLGRIEGVVENETAMLRMHHHKGLAEFTRQKRQGLLELNRLMRALDNTIPSQDLIARLAAFRKKLAANDAALQTALRAAQEVNAIIVRVMRELESDGTYSRAQVRSGYDFE